MKSRKCEVCSKNLTDKQDRFCSKPCQYKGRRAKRNLGLEWLRLFIRFWGRVEVEESGCWLWTGNKTPKGYGTIGFNDKDIYVHHLSWTIAHGSAPKKFVLHSCDVRNCVRPDHLFSGTAKDNSEDMVSKGRVCRGERHPYVKLSENSVSFIRENFEPGNGYDLAKRFGVTRSTITAVVYRRNWKHVV